MKKLMLALSLALLLTAVFALTVHAGGPQCDQCSKTTTLVSSGSECVWQCENGHTTTRSHDPHSNKSGLVPDSCSGSCVWCGHAANWNSHTFVDYVFNNDSTCLEDGTETAACGNANCAASHTRTAVGSALGHDMKGVVTEPLCQEGGYTTYTCQRCGAVEVGDYTTPAGHAYGTWTPVGDGTHQAPCTRKNCYHVGKANCTKVQITMGGQTFDVCIICGDSALAELKPDDTATITPGEGVTLPVSKLALLVDPAPFKEPINSPALYLITAMLQKGGNPVDFAGEVEITVDLTRHEAPVVTHEKLASIPVAELTAADVKMVRLEMVAAEDGTLLETWVELPFTLEKGLLTFKTDKLGAYLMVPADAVAPNAQ